MQVKVKKIQILLSSFILSTQISCGLFDSDSQVEKEQKEQKEQKELDFEDFVYK